MSPSYLASVHTAVEASANHICGDVVPVHLWPLAGVVADQSHTRLLQARITVCFCLKKKQKNTQHHVRQQICFCGT